MRLLVTGGAGFIGSNFIHYVLKKYDDITLLNVDKLTYAANLASLADIQDDSRYTFIKLDITQTDDLRKLIDQYGITHIINFAAESHVDRSIEDASVFYHSNVQGVMSLLQILQKRPALRLLQVSTDEVYGDIPLTQWPVSESAPLAPSSPYAASKAAADLMVHAYCRTYDVNAVITRSANNYGPYQNVEKLIPKMISQALLKQPLPIYGTGQNIRDWLFVLDNCRALDLVLRSGHSGEIYNIAAHEELTNNEIVSKICRLTHADKGLIQYVDDRPGHDLRYAIATDKMDQQLGWRPAVTFSDAIEQTVVWYKTHLEWWTSLNK